MSEYSTSVYSIKKFDEFSINSDKALHELKYYLHKNGVVHIPHQRLEPQEYITFAKKLGLLEIVRPTTHQLDNFEYIRLQSNIPGIGIQGGGDYWHSDSPWYDPPSLYTLLYCAESPNSGGETFFVNMRDFLRSLNPSIKKKLKTLRALYPCKSILEAEFTQMKIQDNSLLTQMNDIIRNLIQKHPVTQEEFLYINEKWLDSILEITVEESRKLLEYIYERIEKFTDRYVHNWNTHDLLVWDNNVVVHKAAKCSPPNRKITHRIIVKSNARPLTLDS